MECINQSISFYNVVEKHKVELCGGSCKLCISPCLLSVVNEALDSLKSNGKSTPVDIPYEERIVLFDLDNIIKASPKIKLAQRNVATFSGVSDLKRCSSLKHAEFFRISLNSITGLNENNEISYLSCSRCTNVFDLFLNDVWRNLKILSLSYCQLSKVETEGFRNLTSVEQLNLSFNNLKSVEGLELLTNLVSLDISFNFIEEIPNFGQESNTRLNELYMSHNNITSLSGLNKIENLTHFDASDNCIYLKEILVELYSLKHLKWLKLINNPLCLRKYYRMYVSHFLGTMEPPFQFLLDEILLNDAELDFIGSSKGIAPRVEYLLPSRATSPLLQTAMESSEVVHDTKSILKSSNRKVKKGRDVTILDPSSDTSVTPAGPSKPTKTGVVVQDSVSFDFKPEPSLDQPVKTDELQLSKTLETNKQVDPQSFPAEVTITKIDTTTQNGKVKILEWNDQIMKQSFHSDLHSSPESTKAESRTVEVTVHATQDDCYLNTVNGKLQGEPQTPQDELKELKAITIDDIRLLESIDLMLQDDKTENETNALSNDDEPLVTSNCADESKVEELESCAQDNVNINELVSTDDKTLDDKSSSDDSAYEFDLPDEENLWAVQKIVDSAPVDILLVLLESELRERSTISGRTIATYPLAFVQSCTQVKDNPITIELVFSSLLKRTSVRTYVMEFADAQTLMNKINVVLASRPEEVEEQLTSFLCKSCNALFSVFKTQARTLCTVCGSALVSEVEKPPTEVVKEPLSHSSSQSSIVASSHGAPENKTPINIDTNPSTVSSSEVSEKSEADSSPFTSTPVQHKYESDVEIISNPSQSSIEVLDERDTPSRKRSSEERHVMITPALPTLEEVSDAQLTSISESTKHSDSNDDDSHGTSQQLVETVESIPVQEPLPISSDDKPNAQQLTESSSSGSVVTSYEATGTVVNTQLVTLYDVPEISMEASEISNEAYETCVEENDSPSPVDSSNQESEGSSTDIYSYTNFTEVDHRIKAFLYQYVFLDDSEELILLVRCHLWKTGGADYPACFVLSNKKIYIFMHTSSVYGLDASNWLQLQESFDFKTMKKVYPLIWNLGVGVLINHLNYFILLQNKKYSDNLLSAFKGLYLKGCDVGSKPSSKVELSIQHVVLTSNYVHNVIDPTILIYTICPRVNILKDDELEETMKLSGFVMTLYEFYIVLGDFSWLAGSGDVPTIHFFRMISNLIEVGQKDNVVSLHFLDETEAVEVVWKLHCSNQGQLSAIINTMRGPWENIYDEPLRVSCK